MSVSFLPLKLILTALFLGRIEGLFCGLVDNVYAQQYSLDYLETFLCPQNDDSSDFYIYDHLISRLYSWIIILMKWYIRSNLLCLLFKESLVKPCLICSLYGLKQFLHAWFDCFAWNFGMRCVKNKDLVIWDICLEFWYAIEC